MLELDVIKSRNFIDYFLLVDDFLKEYDSKGWIRNAGRGSVGGSEISSILKIILIDSINNDLIFERFINKYKEELPDIDIDIQKEIRQNAIDLLINKYGKDNVVRAGTILKFKEDSALNEVAKIIDIPKYVITDIKSKLVKRTSGDARHGNIISQAFFYFPELNKWKEKYPLFFKLVTRIEGIKKTQGTHASGIMILKEPYYNYFAIMKKNQFESTCFEYPEMERNGLMKLDILGIEELDIVADVLKNKNIKLDYENPDGNNKNTEEVYDLIKQGYNRGIFQIGTETMIQFGVRIVDNFNDLVALNGICRPSSIRYHIPQRYEEFKKTGKLNTIHPLIDNDSRFKNFGNLIIFQEQVMVIFTEIGGYYLVDSNSVIKAISKSKGIITFEQQYRPKFLEGAQKKGLTKEEANKIFDSVFQAGSYMFNKSHCVLYAHLIYYTAWLKVKYPIEFYKYAIMHSNEEEVKKIISEMENRNFVVLEPNIDNSLANEIKIVDEKTILLPLSYIKYLTSKQIEKIIENRPYIDLNDAIIKNKISGRAKESLIVNMSNSDSIFDIIKKIKVSKIYSASRYMKKICDAVLNKTGEKYYTLSELRDLRMSGKTILYVSSKKLGSWGDWLPLEEKPTEEMIKNEPEKYSFLKKYNWMEKWCKIQATDINNEKTYCNIFPDIYKNISDILLSIKAGDIIIAEIAVGKTTLQRSEIKNIMLVNKILDVDNNG